MQALITPAIGFVSRHWKALALGAVGLAVAIAFLVLLIQRNDARSDRDAARAELSDFVTRTKAEAERARREAAENIIRVEREQVQISEERSSAYQARIAELRRRVAALGLRDDTDGASAGGDAATVPGVPDASGGLDDPAARDRLSAAERIIATEQAIQLDELQRWIREQSRLNREAAR